MNEAQWLNSTEPQAMLAWLMGRGESEILGGTPFPARPSDRKLRLWCCAVVRQAWNKLTDKRSRRAVEVAERFADGLATAAELKAARNACRTLGGPDVAGRWCCLIEDTEAALHVHRAVGTHSTETGLVTYALQAGLLRCVMGNPFRPVRLPMERNPNHTEFGYGLEQPPFRCPWLTPTVLSLAQVAYEDRPIWKCQRCWGTGDRNPGQSAHHYDRPKKSDDCPDCNGSGRIQDGTLDPDRLAVLSDALEEAGCPQEVEEYAETECPHCDGAGEVYGSYFAEDGMEPCQGCEGRCTVWADVARPHPLLAHLRGPGPHVRGDWALDLFLGKE